MDARVKSLVTLGVLGVILVIAAVWGWNSLSQPFPGRAEPPVCRDREFARGDTLTPRDVTVSVQNAGSRVGLAGLTMDLLSEAGFHQGDAGNTPGRRGVDRVEIWTDEPRSPAVQLVASHLGGADVVRRQTDAPGVLVVVGNDFNELSPGREQVRVQQPATVCGPPRLARRGGA